MWIICVVCICFMWFVCLYKFVKFFCDLGFCCLGRLCIEYVDKFVGNIIWFVWWWVLIGVVCECGKDLLEDVGLYIVMIDYNLK